MAAFEEISTPSSLSVTDEKHVQEREEVVIRSMFLNAQSATGQSCSDSSSMHRVNLEQTRNTKWDCCRVYAYTPKLSFGQL
jgi:hypothetical protein